MSAAIAAGLLVLICAALLVLDVVIELLRRRPIDEQARESHRALMNEIRRYDEPTIGRR